MSKLQRIVLLLFLLLALDISLYAEELGWFAAIALVVSSVTCGLIVLWFLIVPWVDSGED